MPLQADHPSCATSMVKAAKIPDENQKFSRGFQGTVLLPDVFHFCKPGGKARASATKAGL